MSFPPFGTSLACNISGRSWRLLGTPATWTKNSYHLVNSSISYNPDKPDLARPVSSPRPPDRELEINWPVTLPNAFQTVQSTAHCILFRMFCTYLEIWNFVACTAMLGLLIYISPYSAFSLHWVFMQSTVKYIDTVWTHKNVESWIECVHICICINIYVAKHAKDFQLLLKWMILLDNMYYIYVYTHIDVNELLDVFEFYWRCLLDHEANGLWEARHWNPSCWRLNVSVVMVPGIFEVWMWKSE